VTLRISAEGAVSIVTLARPEVLNAFDEELGAAVLDAVRRASEDASVRCIVITGEGRAFSSGEDLGALAGAYSSGAAPDLGRILEERYNPLVEAVRAAPKPVVAALNGVAAGAGASLALACDVRIASDNARIVFGFSRVGLVPDSAGLWFLARAVGVARAYDIVTLERPIGAGDALALGLVNDVYPAHEFDAGWRARAASLAAGPTRAYALTKRLLQDAPARTLQEQLALEVDAQREASRTADHREGVAAFLEKRDANFLGR
jgi:2-(1,2-epoxy-1,2-dihydrophenyl)acetyl-CoA isomerase